MSRSPSNIYSALIILSLLLSTFSCISYKTGGECQSYEETLFASITEIKTDRVTLTAENGDLINLPPDQFSGAIKPGSFYEINIRRHTTGGCSPLSVLKVHKLDKKGVQLSPDEMLAYQGAFILSSAKNCVSRQNDMRCNKLVSDIPEYQLSLLREINPRSLKPCTGKSLRRVWSSLPERNDIETILFCAEGRDNNIYIVEFSVTGGKSARLQLEGIY